MIASFGRGVSDAVRGLLAIGGTTGLLLVGATDLLQQQQQQHYTQTENIKYFW